QPLNDCLCVSRNASDIASPLRTEFVPSFEDGELNRSNPTFMLGGTGNIREGVNEVVEASSKVADAIAGEQAERLGRIAMHPSPDEIARCVWLRVTDERTWLVFEEVVDLRCQGVEVFL